MGYPACVDCVTLCGDQDFGAPRDTGGALAEVRRESQAAQEEGGAAGVHGGGPTARTQRGRLLSPTTRRGKTVTYLIL